jgi:hypothetical protein
MSCVDVHVLMCMCLLSASKPRGTPRKNSPPVFALLPKLYGL